MSGPDHATAVALVFDDGFPQSALCAAQIYESFGQRATFAVLAQPKVFGTAREISDCGANWRIAAITSTRTA